MLMLRLCHRIAALGLALLAGCAAAPPAGLPPGLLNDALFGHPAPPPDAPAVFSLSPAMLHEVQALLARTPRAADRPRALLDALRAIDGLKLDYDASFTRNAAQAHAARAGNCLSLVVMTAALARAMGLEVGFQATHSGEAISREADLILRTGHVNLVLGAERRTGTFDGSAMARNDVRWVVDFMPAELLRGQRMDRIDERRVLAMFMNNRAVETLIEQRPAEAYAWVREALRQDAAYAAAVNTLGVVYQRAGHLAAAAAAFEQALVHDVRHVAAISNLVPVLRALGRQVEAARWAERLVALEPYPPGHFLVQGQVAMAERQYRLARRLFQQELAQAGPSHDVHFWLAQAHWALGEAGQARTHLQAAMAWSANPSQQARYAAKLQALQGQTLH
jgi:Tfp pilus assembly protein PilF